MGYDWNIKKNASHNILFLTFKCSQLRFLSGKSRERYEKVELLLKNKK